MVSTSLKALENKFIAHVLTPTAYNKESEKNLPTIQNGGGNLSPPLIIKDNL